MCACYSHKTVQVNLLYITAEQTRAESTVQDGVWLQSMNACRVSQHTSGRMQPCYASHLAAMLLLLQDALAQLGMLDFFPFLQSHLLGMQRYGTPTQHAGAAYLTYVSMLNQVRGMLDHHWSLIIINCIPRCMLGMHQAVWHKHCLLPAAGRMDQRHQKQARGPSSSGLLPNGCWELRICKQ